MEIELEQIVFVLENNKIHKRAVCGILIRLATDPDEQPDVSYELGTTQYRVGRITKEYRSDLVFASVEELLSSLSKKVYNAESITND